MYRPRTRYYSRYNASQILGAMGPRICAVKEQMTIERTYRQARMQFVEGLLGEVPWLLFSRGGKVDAACTNSDC